MKLRLCVYELMSMYKTMVFPRWKTGLQLIDLTKYAKWWWHHSVSCPGNCALATHTNHAKEEQQLPHISQSFSYFLNIISISVLIVRVSCFKGVFSFKCLVHPISNIQIYMGGWTIFLGELFLYLRCVCVCVCRRHWLREVGKARGGLL